MTEAKPLSKERRAEIEADVHRRVLMLASERAYGDAEVFDPILDAFVDLLRAEQFWREAVKEADLYYVEDVCPWCCKYAEHKQGCPHVLAQEET